MDKGVFFLKIAFRSELNLSETMRLLARSADLLEEVMRSLSKYCPRCSSYLRTSPNYCPQGHIKGFISHESQKAIDQVYPTLG